MTNKHTYRVSCVNHAGEVYKRTTTDLRAAEFMWHDVDLAGHVFYAAFFIDGRLARQYIKNLTPGRG